MRRIHRDIVGVFLFSKDGHLLLGKSRKGGVYKDFWIIPGGGIEEGESKLDAARRETLEEVGIDISEYEAKKLDYNQTGESEKTLKDTNERVLVDMTFFDFVVRADRNAADMPVVCGDDIVEASWHNVSDLAKLQLTPPTVTTLKHLGYL